MNNGKERIALVTGATGFVGSHLALRLVQDGWQVHIVVRKCSLLPDVPEFSQIIIHIYSGTTENMIEVISQVKPSLVFHLASLFIAQHNFTEVESLIQSNVLFGTQLLEAMKVNDVGCLINTSTSWQHFNNEDYNPVCLYAATKQAFEDILEYYVQAFNFKAITLKLFDTYGPNDPRPKLFNLLDKAATSGEPLNMSAGEQLIDLVHIEDVIDAYSIAANRLLDNKVVQHESYAISSGCPLPLKKLVRLYSEVTKQNVVVNWGARPYRFREVMRTWTSGAKLTGWNPKISLEDGMKSS